MGVRYESTDGTLICQTTEGEFLTPFDGGGANGAYFTAVWEEVPDVPEVVCGFSQYNSDAADSGSRHAMVNLASLDRAMRLRSQQQGDKCTHMVLDGRLQVDLTDQLRSKVFPTLATRFPLLSADHHIHMFLYFETAVEEGAAAAAADWNYGGDAYHTDVHEVTIDVSLSNLFLQPEEQSHHRQAFSHPSSREFLGGGFDVEGRSGGGEPARFLPHLPAGQCYAWGQDFRHRARRISEGSRVSLVCMVSQPIQNRPAKSANSLKAQTHDEGAEASGGGGSGGSGGSGGGGKPSPSSTKLISPVVGAAAEVNNDAQGAKNALVLSVLALFDQDRDFSLSLMEVNEMNHALGQPAFSSQADLQRVADSLGVKLTDSGGFSFSCLVHSYADDAELAGDISTLISKGYLPPAAAVRQCGGGGEEDESSSSSGSLSYEPGSSTLSFLGRLQVLGIAAMFSDHHTCGLSLDQVNQMNLRLGQPSFTSEASLAALACKLGHTLTADARFPVAALMAAYEEGQDRLLLDGDVEKAAACRSASFGFTLGDLRRCLMQCGGPREINSAAVAPSSSTSATQLPPAGRPTGESSDHGLCVVCDKAKRSCAMVPCGHIATCEDDAVSIVGQQCPLCAAAVTSALRVYF